MNDFIRLLTTFSALLITTTLSNITPASARGGAAASIMNSPGYQRALEESRKRYEESYGKPYVQSPAVYPHKKWKHRGRRH